MDLEKERGGIQQSNKNKKLKWLQHPGLDSNGDCGIYSVT